MLSRQAGSGAIRPVQAPHRENHGEQHHALEGGLVSWLGMARQRPRKDHWRPSPTPLVVAPQFAVEKVVAASRKNRPIGVTIATRSTA